MRWWRDIGVAMVLASQCCAQSVDLLSYVKKGAVLREFMGIEKTNYHNHPNIGKVRIAILDRGFQGLGPGQKYLPDSAKLVESYGTQDFVPMAPNYVVGRQLGQLIWVLTADYEDLKSGPEMHFFNANYFVEAPGNKDEYYVDPTNFIKAVEAAIAWKADIILCNVHFEIFGNYDGKGGINHYVSEATSKGILWVQSAGDYRGRTYESPVPAQDAVYIEVKSWAMESRATFILNWNANAPGTDAPGTDKDLAIALYKDLGSAKQNKNPIRVQDRKQIMGTPQKLTETVLPYEAFRARLDMQKSPYIVKIWNEGGRFDGDDTMRLTVLSDRPPVFIGAEKRLVDPIEIVRPTDPGGVTIPVDHPETVSVGSWSQWSSVGNVGKIAKPTFILDSGSIEFSDRQTLSGTQVAAAELTAAAASMKAASNLRMKPEDFKEWLEFLKRERGADAYRAPAKSQESYELDGFVFGQLWLNTVADLVADDAGAAAQEKVLDLVFSDVVAGRVATTTAKEKFGVLGINKSPVELSVFKSVDKTAIADPLKYDFFLFVRREGKKDVVYSTAEPKGSAGAAAPWKKYKGASTDYYQIVELPEFSTSPTKTRSSRWRMPSDSELSELLK